MQDFRDLVRLCQALNAVHFFGGYPVEPTDIHASVRHLHATRSLLTLSDKVAARLQPRARSATSTAWRWCASPARSTTRPWSGSRRSTRSSTPARRCASTSRCSQGIMQYSPAQPGRSSSRRSPWPGRWHRSRSPVRWPSRTPRRWPASRSPSWCGPGAPVVYGGFTSNVDMQSGSPAFGTPEYMKAALVGGQLARRVRVPYRSSNVCAANAVDAQAGYESVFSLWGAVMGGANFVMHGAGWMEGGLRASYEKMVIDADLLQMVAAVARPDDRRRRHAGGRRDRRGRPRRALLRRAAHPGPRSATRSSRRWSPTGATSSRWEEAGSPDGAATRRPPRPGAAGRLRAAGDGTRGGRQELDDFVARRVAEGGVATDF